MISLGCTEGKEALAAQLSDPTFDGWPDRLIPWTGPAPRLQAAQEGGWRVDVNVSSPDERPVETNQDQGRGIIFGLLT